MDRGPLSGRYGTARYALPVAPAAAVPPVPPLPPYSLAAPRARRRHRSRRTEYLISSIALAALAVWACTVRPRPAPTGPPGQAPAQADSGRALEHAAGLVPAAAAAGLAGAAGQRAAGAVVPAVAFSFAKFEADPALVAGAASTGVPNLSGESAIVVDLNTKDVIYAKNARKRHHMASTTKIMTAIVAAERSPLDRVLTVPVEATQVEPNHMGIRAGERLTVEELLYGLMLDSGNDAAEALAFGVGGGGPAGRAQFIGWMNDKVAALGLKDTRFANPSGIDDPNQHGTAYDLAVIGAHALGKPELRRIFGAKEVVIPPSKEPGREHGWFGPGNLNSLLWSYRGALGIKPGYTEDAGYTLVAAAERDGRTLIAVTLNSRRHFSDCALLLDFGFNRP